MARFAMLDVFSGMPNPVWPADEDLVAPMLDRAAPDTDEAPPLGYRGFRIVDTDTDPEQLAATTADAIGSYSDVARIFGNPDDERALLEAGVNAGAISDDLRGYVADAIGSPSSSGPAVSAIAEPCPPCGGIDAPSYDPGYWNDPSRQRFNNCYAYANNNATGTFPQPGRGTGAIFTTLDCADVGAASNRDGLVTTSTFQASRAGWYVALVLWPGQDYHWYRQDDIGCWSHKPGQTVARNVDSSGRKITDPQTCDRGPYTDFCTFMVSDANVTIA